MSKKKKEEKINPQFEERKGKLDDKHLEKLDAVLDSSTVTLNDDSDESFFKSVVGALNDKKNISMKTEYLNVAENFNGTKLDFLARMGNMPYLGMFVNIFETKRVSLQRKGRTEDVMILQKREEELQNNKLKEFSRMFGVQ